MRLVSLFIPMNYIIRVLFIAAFGNRNNTVTNNTAQNNIRVYYQVFLHTQGI